MAIGRGKHHKKGIISFEQPLILGVGYKESDIKIFKIPQLKHLIVMKNVTLNKNKNKIKIKLKLN